MFIVLFATLTMRPYNRKRPKCSGVSGRSGEIIASREPCHRLCSAASRASRTIGICRL